MWDKDKKKMC